MNPESVENRAFTCLINIFQRIFTPILNEGVGAKNAMPANSMHPPHIFFTLNLYTPCLALAFQNLCLAKANAPVSLSELSTLDDYTFSLAQLTGA